MEGQDLSCPSNPPWPVGSITSELIVIDLGALELVGIVDVDGLPLGEKVDGSNGGFAVAVAGLLGAAERQVCFSADCRSVYIDNSGIEIARSLEGAIHVSRINRSGKPIGHAVRHIDGLFETAKRNHRNNRAENLLLRNAHIRRTISEHRRFVEPPFGVRAVVEAIAPSYQLGAFILSTLHILHHRLQ